MLRARVISVLLMMGAGIVGAHAFALSLFCLTVTLVPIMAATEYLVMRQLERVVLSQGESCGVPKLGRARWTEHVVHPR
jgi:hypothetical protein